MRLIDADKLKEDDELTLWLSNDAVRTGKTLKMFSELFVKKIDEQPTISDKSERKTGWWMLVNRNGVNKYVCSECDNEPLLIGESYPIVKLSDYCPYCGAKMEVNNVHN